jgi:hypothetical protein
MKTFGPSLAYSQSDVVRPQINIAKPRGCMYKGFSVGDFSLFLCSKIYRAILKIAKSDYDDNGVS